MEIKGLTQLVEKLKAKAARTKDDDGVSVSVGYTQSYAIYVHENLQAVHPVGQAKFLEQPARQLTSSGELHKIIAAALQARKTMSQGLLLAGLRLQRESMKLVPVDTGALKNSAFTRLNTGGATGSAGGAVPSTGVPASGGGGGTGPTAAQAAQATGGRSSGPGGGGRKG